MTTPGNDSYFSYYQDRRKKADQYNDLISLPLIVISNSTDYDMLEDALKMNPSRKGMQELLIDLLGCHKEKEILTNHIEDTINNSDFTMVLIFFSGWIIAIILFLAWFFKL